MVTGLIRVEGECGSWGTAGMGGRKGQRVTVEAGILAGLFGAEGRCGNRGTERGSSTAEGRFGNRGTERGSSTAEGRWGF